MTHTVRTCTRRDHLPSPTARRASQHDQSIRDQSIREQNESCNELIPFLCAWRTAGKVCPSNVAQTRQVVKSNKESFSWGRSRVFGSKAEHSAFNRSGGVRFPEGPLSRSASRQAPSSGGVSRRFGWCRWSAARRCRAAQSVRRDTDERGRHVGASACAKKEMIVWKLFICAYV